MTTEIDKIWFNLVKACHKARPKGSVANVLKSANIVGKLLLKENLDLKERLAKYESPDN